MSGGLNLPLRRARDHSSAQVLSMPYRVFLVVYLVVAIPAAVFVAFPPVLLIVLLFTFGLAFPLALLPAVAVYLTALWPAVLVWRDGRRALAAMIAVAALARLSQLGTKKGNFRWRGREFASQYKERRSESRCSIDQVSFPESEFVYDSWACI
jgi:hypothetical protein